MAKRTIEIFSPVIEFSYTIQGKSYLSNRVTLSGFNSYSTSDKKEAEDYLKPFTENASRTCLVNPKNPESAALEAGFPTWSVVLGGGMGAIFLACGLLFFYIARRWKTLISSPSAQVGPQNFFPIGDD